MTLFKRQSHTRDSSSQVELRESSAPQADSRSASVAGLKTQDYLNIDWEFLGE